MARMQAKIAGLMLAVAYAAIAAVAVSTGDSTWVQWPSRWTCCCWGRR
jgi:hypothetical protein